MSISIQASASSVAATGPSGGTDLQRAYQAATKDLREAQQQLTKDTAAKASEDTIKADQIAVQLAQAAVAAAAAAIAKANADAQQQKQADHGAERALRNTFAIVDVYA